MRFFKKKRKKNYRNKQPSHKVYIVLGNTPPSNPTESLCAEIQATPPFSSTGFSLRLVCFDNCWQHIQPPIAPRNPTEPLCAEIQATPPSRAQDAALMYVPIIVGNRFSLRLLHATRLKFAVSIFDLGNTYTRTSPSRLQNRLGQRDFTQPSRTAVCCDMGDSTLTSNRAADW